jgi:SAM-dependent methyltransferase
MAEAQATLEEAEDRLNGARSLLQDINTRMKNLKSLNVLDIGCGIGNILLATAELDANRVVGIDIDLRLFGKNHFGELAKKHNINTANVEFIEGDFCHIDLGEEAFDLIICFDVIEHIRSVKNVKMLAKNINRLLKSDGIGVIDVSPLYYSRMGHHLFSYFDPSEYPWAHLYKNFNSLLRKHRVDDWSIKGFRGLNRITYKQLQSIFAEAGLLVTKEHLKESGRDIISEFQARIDMRKVPSEDDLFLEWIRFDLTKNNPK